MYIKAYSEPMAYSGIFRTIYIFSQFQHGGFQARYSWITQEQFTLREKCPNTEFSWSVFSPNTGKYGPEKTLYLDNFHAELRIF